MKRVVSTLFLVLFFSCLGLSQTPATDPHWELYSEEEFNTYSDVTELEAKWNSPVWPLEKKGLKYLFNNGVNDNNYNYGGWLYYHAFQTKFSDHHNYFLETGDGDGSLCIQPKFEPTPYYVQIIKDWGNYTVNPPIPTTYEDAYFTMTTGSFSSNEKLLNGFFEMRMRLPYYAPYDNQYTYYGTMPTFWLYSETVNGQNEKINVSELDIFEIFNGRNANSGGVLETNSSLVTSNVHCWDVSNFDTPLEDFYSDERKELDWEREGIQHSSDRIITYEGNGWHTFGLEWNPEYVIFYIDGEQVRKSTRYINQLTPMSVFIELKVPPDIGAPITYPSTNMSLNNPLGLFPMPQSVPMASSNGGPIYNNPGPNLDPNFKYEIDYVKIYKLKRNCDEIINQSTYNFYSHTPEVIQSISLGGNSGAVSTVSVGQDVQLRASDFVLLRGDIEIPQGATFSMTAQGCPENGSQYECNLTPYINCGFNSNSYDDNIKSLIDINGNGCSSSLPNGHSLILRARDYINLKEIDSKLYSDLTIKIENCQ